MLHFVYICVSLFVVCYISQLFCYGCLAVCIDLFFLALLCALICAFSPFCFPLFGQLASIMEVYSSVHSSIMKVYSCVHSSIMEVYSCVHSSIMKVYSCVHSSIMKVYSCVHSSIMEVNSCVHFFLFSGGAGSGAAVGGSLRGPADGRGQRQEEQEERKKRQTSPSCRHRLADSSNSSNTKLHKVLFYSKHEASCVERLQVTGIFQVTQPPRKRTTGKCR